MTSIAALIVSDTNIDNKYHTSSYDLQEDLFFYVKNSPNSSLNTKTWKSYKTGKDIMWSDETLKLADSYKTQLYYFEKSLY